jgi:hypothetical protein
VENILRRTYRIEKIAGIESVIAEVLVGAAVEFVGSGFGDHVNRSSGIVPELGFEIALDRNFLQGVEGQL